MKFSLKETLIGLVKDLNHGLRKLTFTHNMEGFETTLVIGATTELEVRNELTFKPSRYIILSQTGNGLVTKGSTAWSSNNLYLYNNGAEEVTIIVFFMK